MPILAPPEDVSARPTARGERTAADAPPDERFARLVRLARQHFGVGAGFIALSAGDRLRLAACEGLSPADASAYGTLCAQVLPGAGTLVVPDTCADLRFADQPRGAGNPSVRFLAGCPLVGTDGRRLGAFCLLDERPRDLPEDQRGFLGDLAALAVALLESDVAAACSGANAEILRESEKRMALAIAGSGTGIWDRNVRNGEIYYSRGWKAIFGYSEEEVSSRIEDSYTRIHPDDLAYVRASMQAHFDRQTESYAVEHRIRCKDGSYKWISSRGKVVSRDSAGRALRMIGTSTDITAMHAMSERLQQTVDLITNLTNEVPGLVFQCCMRPGGEAFFSYASAGIADIYELAPEQLASGTTALEAIIHPDDLPAYRASLEASAANLAPWQHEYRVLLPRQGLRWRQGVARPRRLADGGTLWHGLITDVTERKRMEAELQEFATIDFLTQLPNRRHFMTQIEAELARIQRSGRCAAVLMCDLDYFKAINDRWGHAVGDQALRHFAAILRGQLRRSDMVGRVGGEEFAVVLGDADVAEAMAFARRLQQRVAEAPLQEGGQCIVLTLSIGIAIMSASENSVDAALSRSDMALYRAKESGRNRIETL